MRITKEIWVEKPEPAEDDVCDVIVKMEDGSHYTAVFVTMVGLRRQLDLGFHGACDHPACHPARYVAIDTPHVVVDDLECDTLLDAIECMIDLDTFESCFTRVNEDEALNTGDNRRRCATAEMLKVVIRDVLNVTGVA